MKARADEDLDALNYANITITQTRNAYRADCAVFLTLFERHFPRTSLSTNAHSAVCRAIYEMEMMGAIIIELGIERTVSYQCLIEHYRVHANFM